MRILPSLSWSFIILMTEKIPPREPRGKKKKANFLLWFSINSQRRQGHTMSASLPPHTKQTRGPARILVACLQSYSCLPKERASPHRLRTRSPGCATFTAKLRPGFVLPVLLIDELQTRVSRNLPLGLAYFLENPRKQLCLMIYIIKDITKDRDQDVPGAWQAVFFECDSCEPPNVGAKVIRVLCHVIF